MNDGTMRADCTRCAALCCVALALTPAQGFAIEKPNGKACPNLTNNNQCCIYDQRQNHGFQGCIKFDCLGAGQIITQDVFGGRNWREEPDILPGMVKTFGVMREIQEFKTILASAAKLPLTTKEQNILDNFLDALHPQNAWSQKALDDYSKSETKHHIKRFITRLKPYFKLPFSLKS